MVHQKPHQFRFYKKNGYNLNYYSAAYLKTKPLKISSDNQSVSVRN